MANDEAPERRMENRRLSDAEGMAQGVTDLAVSVTSLASTFQSETASRNRRTRVLATIGIIILIPSLLSSIFIIKIVQLERETKRTTSQSEQILRQNADLLSEVGSVSNPDAVAARVRSSQDAIRNAILCIENHIDIRLNPAITVIPGCPDL